MLNRNDLVANRGNIQSESRRAEHYSKENNTWPTRNEILPQKRLILPLLYYYDSNPGSVIVLRYDFSKILKCL